MKKIVLVLMLLVQFSFSQNYTEYLTGNSTDLVVSPEQGICLMGGASESDEAMQWFLNKANGGDVVVLRASGSDGYNNYFYTDLGVSINSVRTFVINNVTGATDSYVLDKIDKAEAIWFAGGDQYDYVSYFKDNAMEDALNSFVNAKLGVIGGTSAGMAILGSSYFDASNGTVTNDVALGNPYHNKVSLGYNDFLNIPFLENVITDTHYDDPDRRARHSVFLARFSQDNGLRSFGIACNEYTAVCVGSDGRAYVYGDYPNYEEHAFFLQSNCVDSFMPENCSNGNALNWVRDGEAIKVYKVPGMTTGENYFDLSNWTNGSGGTWQNWYVTNGTFTTNSTTNPECNVLGVEEFEPLITIKIQPNPFSNKLNVISSNLDYKVLFYNVFGEEIAINHKMGVIDAEHLASGIYFLKVYSERFSKTFKIIKK